MERTPVVIVDGVRKPLPPGDTVAGLATTDQLTSATSSTPVHNHDASYAPLVHNHDTSYAPLVHNHASPIQIASITADVTNNNATANTLQDVTGLSFPVTSGQRYWFRFQIRYTAAATTTGSRWSINGPAVTELMYDSEYSLTATTKTSNFLLTSYNLPAASNATSASTGANRAIIEGYILPSANGNVIARFASEVANSAIVAKRGSMVQWMAVG